MLILISVFTGQSQCIFTKQSPNSTIVSNNSGTLQYISDFAFANNYASISNLLIGGKYTFNCSFNETSQGFITITDANDVVIKSGNSPLTVENITTSNIRMHYSENSSCGSNFSILTLNFQFTQPDCPSSTNITANNITTTSATFNWTAGTGVTKWEVIVQKKGGAKPIPSTFGTQVNGNPTYTNNNLEHSTQYEFYVRSICGDELGLWIAIEFTSKCIPVDAFDENFDDTPLGTLPVCWSSIIEGTYLSPYAYIATENFDAYANSAQAMQIFRFDSSENSEFILVTPQLNTLPTSKYRMKFFARGNGPATIDIGTLNDNTPAANFTSFTTIELTGSYAEYTVDFTTDNITDTYAGIRIVSGTSVFVDNIRWLPTLDCQDVLNVSVSNITNQTADVAWEAGGNENHWELVYGIASEANNPEELKPITVDFLLEPKTTLTDLTENTTYKVWVRSVCNGNDNNGIWVGPQVFTTDCTGIPEFNENFDTTIVANLPICWSAVLSGEDLSIDAVVQTTNLYPYSGDHAAELYTASSGKRATVMLVSPNLSTLKNATHRLRFYARSGSEAQLEIGTLSGLGKDAVFTPKGERMLVTNEYQEYNIGFSDYYQNDTHIGFKNVSYDSQSTILLDNIRWDLIPICADITNLTSSQITGTSATIKWQIGESESKSQLAYGEKTIDDSSTIISDVLNETTYDLVDLKGNTAYNVWVRSVCEAGYGNWIQISLKTLPTCETVNALNENFDTTSINKLPDCWSAILSGATLDNDASVYVVDYNSYSQKNSVRLNNYTSTSSDNIILVSPKLNKIAGSVLKFYARADQTSTLIVGTLNGDDNTATFTPFSQQITLTKDYKEFTIDFKAYSGTDQYIGFKNVSLVSYTPVTLDNIMLEETNLSNNAFDKSNFSYFPNPVKNILNLSSIQNMSHVAVFNIIGQKVLEAKIDTKATELNLSALTKGTYLVKISSNGQMNTIKIIKE